MLVPDRKLQTLPPFALPPPEQPRANTALGALVPDEPEPEPQPEPPAAAPTKFATSLKLTPQQASDLTQYALARMREVGREMGLTEAGEVTPESWMDIRQRNSDSYDGDLTWRAALGGVFTESNATLGTNVRHTRYLSARIQDDLLGTTPFFAAMGRNADKAKEAKQVEEFVQGVIDRSKVRQGLRRAQKTALIINEAVVKTSWVVDATPFSGPATVMVDTAGQPIKTPAKGLYIFENDNFLPSPVVEQAPPPATDPAAPPAPVDPNAPPAPAQVQIGILEKDPSFQMRAGEFKYQKFDALPQKLVLYEGPKADPLDFRSFLCPLRAPSIHEADICVHLYLETPMRMQEIYGDVDVGQNYFAKALQPKTKQGEQPDVGSSVLKQMQIAEVYVRTDADGDGVAEEIFMVIDLQNQEPIFYDYLANHFFRRPFEVVVGIEEVANRWYGRGIFSLGEDQEILIDVQLNRALRKGSRTSGVTFRRKGGCLEWDNGLPVVVGGDDILTCNPDFNPEDNPPIFRVNLADPPEQALEMMEIGRAASDSLVGAISAKDASQSDLNQSKTATGIVNLQAASDVITKATTIDQTEGINAILWQVVRITLKNMGETVLMVTKDTSQLVTLNRSEIGALETDVRLTLTRSRSTQMQQVSAQAILIAKDYQMTLATDPQAAKRMRPLYIQQLKALEVNEADDICPEVTDEMLAAFQQQQQAAAQPPPEHLAMDYKSAPEPIRRQMEERAGFTPLTPAEAAAEAAKQKTDEKPTKSGAAEK